MSRKVPTRAATLFAKSKHSAVIVRLLQPVEDQFAYQFRRRLFCATRSAGYGLDQVDVEVGVRIARKVK